MRPLLSCTLLTQTPARILSYINELCGRFTGSEYTFLFALSATFDHPYELEETVSTIRNLRCDRGYGKARIVGCLSGPVSSIELPGGRHAGLSCAVAVFDSRHCHPFYSELQGREEAQVGRWHSFRRKAPDGSERLDMLEGRTLNWEDVWNNRNSSSINKGLLPENLRSISPSKIHTLLYMTKNHPDLFMLALSDFLSSSTSSPMSLGLVAAPTHFDTGRDVTIFFDDKIYGNGTVGLALLNSKGKEEEAPPKVMTEFIGLQKLGEPMTVTSGEGNMVNSLDNSNPTQLLLRASEISSNRSAPTFRDDEIFALAVLNPAGDILRALKITAGDPTSRGGSISLDTAEAPTQGSIVQFLRRAPNASLRIPSSLLSSTSPTNSSIAYLAVPESLDRQVSSMMSGTQLILGTFLATSTSGFLLSQFVRNAHHSPDRTSNPIIMNTQEDQWTCSLPGGMGVLKYH